MLTQSISHTSPGNRATLDNLNRENQERISNYVRIRYLICSKYFTDVSVVFIFCVIGFEFEDWLADIRIALRMVDSSSHVDPHATKSRMWAKESFIQNWFQCWCLRTVVQNLMLEPALLQCCSKQFGFRRQRHWSELPALDMCSI